jgi:hypothetical protein
MNLVLAVAKNFTTQDMASFEGKRFNLNTVNGFFTATLPGTNGTNLKGSGNIFFHVARFDSIAPGAFKGIISGLFEADFNSFKISKGRFDHGIDPEQLRL